MNLEGRFGLIEEYDEDGNSELAYIDNNNGKTFSFAEENCDQDFLQYVNDIIAKSEAFENSDNFTDLKKQIFELKQQQSVANLKLWRLINHLKNVNPNYTTKYFKAIMDGKLPSDVSHLQTERFTTEVTDTGVYYYEYGERIPNNLDEFWNIICRLENEIDKLKLDKNKMARQKQTYIDLIKLLIKLLSENMGLNINDDIIERLIE